MHTCMNDTAFILCPDFLKLKKIEKNWKKKKDRPIDPPNFQAKRANKSLIFQASNSNMITCETSAKTCTLNLDIKVVRLAKSMI